MVRLANQVWIDQAPGGTCQPAKGKVCFGQQPDSRSAQSQLARHRMGHEGDNAIGSRHESAWAIRFERRGLHGILASYRNAAAILPSVGQPKIAP
jgi:hypothetical protein